MKEKDIKVEDYDDKLTKALDLKKAKYDVIIGELENTEMSTDEFIELKKKANNLAIQIETEENILNDVFKRDIYKTNYPVVDNRT